MCDKQAKFILPLYFIYIFFYKKRKEKKIWNSVKLGFMLGVEIRSGVLIFELKKKNSF